MPPMIPWSRTMGLAGAALTLACGGAPRAPAAGSPASVAIRDNPFAGARFYVNPEYVAKIESTVASAPAQAERLRRVEAFPTAIWLDSAAKARRASHYLDEAMAQEKQSAQPVVTVFVLYDLPGRDCAATASGGELSIGAGESRYK